MATVKSLFWVVDMGFMSGDATIPPSIWIGTIVYVADPTGESKRPGAVAYARSVVVIVRWMGPLTTRLLGLGFVPLFV